MTRTWREGAAVMLPDGKHRAAKHDDVASVLEPHRDPSKCTSIRFVLGEEESEHRNRTEIPLQGLAEKQQLQGINLPRSMEIGATQSQRGGLTGWQTTV